MERCILVIGRQGQLAQELSHIEWPKSVDVSFLGRHEVNLSTPKDIKAAIQEYQPSVIINTAAYTAVDKAEAEQDVARALNDWAARNLAQAALETDVPLLHLSTDYVFDGDAAVPYTETAAINPRSVYGQTKVAGESAIRTLQPHHVIVRTSWIFGRFGQNFLKTMLRLAANHSQVRVVDDQMGGPTPTPDLASALRDIALELAAGRQDGFGTFHYSGAPATTWYDFANEIFKIAQDFGLKPPTLERVDTRAYGAPAPRPSNSILDCSKINKIYGIQQPHWQGRLRDCIGAILAKSPY